MYVYVCYYCMVCVQVGELLLVQWVEPMAEQPLPLRLRWEGGFDRREGRGRFVDGASVIYSL